MATVADVRAAVLKRRDFFLANVETLSMKQARRTLERDLGLAERALDDPERKAAVAKYVDRVLASPDDDDDARTKKPEERKRGPPPRAGPP